MYLCALAMALNCPEAELLAVTTVSDAGGKRAGYARFVLQLAGRTGVPVAAGQTFLWAVISIGSRASIRMKTPIGLNPSSRYQAHLLASIALLNQHREQA